MEILRIEDIEHKLNDEKLSIDEIAEEYGVKWTKIYKFIKDNKKKIKRIRKLIKKDIINSELNLKQNKVETYQVDFSSSKTKKLNKYYFNYIESKLTEPPTNNKQNAWSRTYESCLNCGTRDIPHMSRGLCVKCYRTYNEKKTEKTY